MSDSEGKDVSEKEHDQAKQNEKDQVRNVFLSQTNIKISWCKL